MRIFSSIALAAGICLSACQTAIAFDQIRAVTQEDYDAFSRAMPLMFVDPNAVQLGGITRVGVLHRGDQIVYTFCFGANAKNRMGGYVGAKVYRVEFSGNGEFLDITDGYMMRYCDQLAD